MKKLVIGVTGSIASGKSVISNYIKKQINSTLLDVDVIQKSLNNYDEDRDMTAPLDRAMAQQ